jgi:hypothetical protein
VVPFQIDPSWYERYWLTEHPPRRRGALAERNLSIALLVGGAVVVGMALHLLVT